MVTIYGISTVLLVSGFCLLHRQAYYALFSTVVRFVSIAPIWNYSSILMERVFCHTEQCCCHTASVVQLFSISLFHPEGSYALGRILYRIRNVPVVPYQQFLHVHLYVKRLWSARHRYEIHVTGYLAFYLVGCCIFLAHKKVCADYFIWVTFVQNRWLCHAWISARMLF